MEKYIILKTENSERLEKTVNKFLRDGGALLWGAAATENGKIIYCQAMLVKTKQNTEFELGDEELM